MDVTVVDNSDAGRYEARTDTGEVAGFVEYTRSALALTLVHTEVTADFAGQGVGSRLVRGALGLAERSGLLVINACPFIRSFIHRHPGEYAWVATE
jgi:molybdenum cofactor cytidylyltransferase